MMAGNEAEFLYSYMIYQTDQPSVIVNVFCEQILSTICSSYKKIIIPSSHVILEMENTIWIEDLREKTNWVELSIS